MDKKIKKKWVTALRSGEYKQGTETLYNSLTNRYCCLGVLCHVMGYPTENIADIGYLPSKISRQSGVKTDGELPKSVKFPRGKLWYKNLATMNDKGISFKKIADVIEKYL